MNFVVKTISVKNCARCGTTWCAERITLEPHEKIDFIRVRIAYCPECAEGFAAEVNNPTYERVGKRIK